MKARFLITISEGEKISINYCHIFIFYFKCIAKKHKSMTKDLYFIFDL